MDTTLRRAMVLTGLWEYISENGNPSTMEWLDGLFLQLQTGDISPEEMGQEIGKIIIGMELPI
jgi:hypothetical protein